MHRTLDAGTLSAEESGAGLFVPEGWKGPVPKYQLVKNLNSGSYGQVQLAIDTQTGERVAIKLMERGSKITKYVEREVVNAAKLLHPHIVQVTESPSAPTSEARSQTSVSRLSSCIAP